MRALLHPQAHSLGVIVIAALVFGPLAAVAQVYSLNAVGHVNVTFRPGANLFANPLDSGSNTVANVLGMVPEGTTLYTYNPATGWEVNRFDFGEWTDPLMILSPGIGAQLVLPGSVDFTVTFVGDVQQGNLSNPLAAGFSLPASMVPQAGRLQTDLKFPAADGDVIYLHNGTTQVFSRYDYSAAGGWSPVEPQLAVAQSFILSNHVAFSLWSRAFNIDGFLSDIGLRFYDGTAVRPILCEVPGPAGTPTSPLRIAKNGVIYGIPLVATNSPDATAVRIHTAAGPRAWAQMSSSPGPVITAITRNANGSVTLAWQGGGTLQAAPSVLGPWQDVPGASTPYTYTPSALSLFARIRQ